MQDSISKPLDVLQMTASSLVIFRQYRQRQSRTEKEIQNETNLTRGKFNGYISQKTKGQISKKLNNWVHSLEVSQKGRKYAKGQITRKPTFITLTLPALQRHNDKEIKRVALNNFVISLLRNTTVKYYFWVAETQKNHNIHFHLLADSFVPHMQIREMWNNSLRSLGYIDDFEQKHNHRNPNSTDITAVANFQTATKYLIKYITKNDSNRPISGKLYGMSDPLKGIETFQYLIDSYAQELIEEFMNQPNARTHVEEHFTVMYVDNIDFINNSNNLIAKRYREHLNKIFGMLYRNEPPPDFQKISNFYEVNTN